MSQPPIYPLTSVPVPDVRKIKLDNGIVVYLIPNVHVGICKIDIVIGSGRPQEHKPLASKVAGDLLMYGSAGMSRQELADFFDFKGASYSSQGETDATTITAFSQSGFVTELIPFLYDIVVNPRFDQEEVAQYKERIMARLEDDLHNPDVVAYRQITEDIFGSSHPYGYNSTEALYLDIVQGDLIKTHQEQFRPETTCIILSGTFSDEILQNLNKTFGQWTNSSAIVDIPLRTITTEAPSFKSFQVSSEGAGQASIRIGKRIFNREHRDYYNAYFLNLIFGGYFGSRLMRVLREREAITYDIHSYIESLRNDGLFLISSEVRKGKEDVLLKEIRKSMAQLREYKIDEREIEIARNYLIGQIMVMLDGPFSTSEYLRQLCMEGREISELERLNTALQEVNSDNLRRLAQEIFDWSSFHLVSVY